MNCYQPLWPWDDNVAEHRSNPWWKWLIVVR